MTRVAVIGCGVVGAAIAYELSQNSDVQVMVFDRQPPATAATGAALGVLMGVVSRKAKGRAWALRETSLRRYQQLLTELEELGHPVPVNRQGIVLLCFDAAEIPAWNSLIEIRHQQGWPLQLWSVETLAEHCPQVQTTDVVAAIHSPSDLQINPTALTWALVHAAQQRGATFDFTCPVNPLIAPSGLTEPAACREIQTSKGVIEVDWVVVAAGLGSTELSARWATARSALVAVDIRPVLGQAVRLSLPKPLGRADYQPVITGHDIHIVPLGGGDYWVGATVEFPDEAGIPIAIPDRLDEVLQGAIALCPELANATIVQQWSGLRPRPHDRPAPVIELLPGSANILLATGHYRNGVLLAPATAIAIRDYILAEKPS
jgi:glycine oxidase